MQQFPLRIVTRSKVKLHYSITLADGTEVVSTFCEEPIACRLGDATLAERLESCLIGLSEGDEAVFTLSGDEVFGPASEDNVQSIDISAFPPEMPLSIGQLIAFTTPGGDEVAGLIQNLSDNEAVIDFNHPLCGRTIRFRVMIMEVVNPVTGQPR
jgi:FKBP-type peptidyl-prolyl cis-trans isomerase SlpA